MNDPSGREAKYATVAGCLVLVAALTVYLLDRIDLAVPLLIGTYELFGIGICYC